MRKTLDDISVFIAWRYFVAKKSKNVIHIISWISILTVMTCTAALIVILSVFNGFHVLVEDMYRSVYTDVKVSAREGKTLHILPATLDSLRADKRVAYVGEVVQVKVLIQSDRSQMSAWLKGVDSAYGSHVGVQKLMWRGGYHIAERAQTQIPQIVIGYGLASALGADVDAAITLYFSSVERKANVSVDEDIRVGNFLVSGIFLSKQSEADNEYAFTDLDVLRPYVGLADGAFSHLEIKLREGEDDVAFAKELAHIFPPSHFVVQNHYEQNEGLFSVLSGEKRMIIIILTFVMCIAAFNISSALLLSVMEKKKHIFMLRAMGMTTAHVRSIFWYSGVILGVVGCLMGIVIGSVVVWVQKTWHLVPIQGDGFMVDYFPVRVLWTDYVIVLLLTLGISFLATLYAARKAGRLARAAHLQQLLT